MKLLKKVIIMSIMLCVSDFIIGKTLRILYFNPLFGQIDKTNYVISKTQAPVLIFGTSTAESHYNSEIFQSILGLECFNAGLNATKIPFSSALLSMVIRRYIPNILILDLHYKEFNISSDRFGNTDDLIPFYPGSSILKEVIMQRSSLEKIKMLSRIYPYNSRILKILMGNKSRKREHQGYIPLENKWSGSLRKFIFSNEIDYEMVNYFIKFIILARSKQTNIFVIISPTYYKYLNISPTATIAKKICDQYNIPFWDFSQMTQFISRSEYFLDETHLNSLGADIYSKIVAYRILHYNKK
jgi:hypothetical protein